MESPSRPEFFRTDGSPIEYDGRHHFEDRRQWENDIARRHNLDEEGWVVRVATSRDVFVQADRFGADMLDLWHRRS